jgi:hypothetical protein
MYNYLIVGSGLFGAVFARIMNENGKDTIENRERIIYIVEDLREDGEGMVCFFERLPEVSFIRSLLEVALSIIFKG